MSRSSTAISTSDASLGDRRENGTPAAAQMKEPAIAHAAKRAPKDALKASRKRFTRSKSEELAVDETPSAGNHVSDVSCASSPSADVNGITARPKRRGATTPRRGALPNNNSDEAVQEPDDGHLDANDDAVADNFIDSTLLEEALSAEAIAKSQSELQDVDSLSQSQSLSRLGSVEDEDERKRKRRKCSRLQDTILRILAKTRSDVEHLDEKISALEAQYFLQPAETTGLIKGWESNLLGAAYGGSQNTKSRKGAPPKVKQVVAQTQALVTEHIFSLTSSTCPVSRSLLQKPE
ncbi:histone acetyltransferase subunit nua4 protein [Babesia caballi]|uniref:Histone acetyltransferase subunit nua4 protein n=1 Tax=Babesia caballi TaxID=5871 RepID=A0AAV4LQ10_BABCB|nr:histone acetyltransferase subunit nua4 protein [Babesia caballi]